MKSFFSTLVGVISALLAMTALTLFYFFPQPIILIFIVLGWWLLLAVLSTKFALTRYNVVLHFVTSLSFLVLESIIDVFWLHLVILVAAGLIFFVLWKWSTVASRAPIIFMQKPWRRMIVMIWVFNAYTVFTFMSALHLFFPAFPTFFLTVGSGALSGVIAYMMWTLYKIPNAHEYVAWAVLVAFLMIELTAVLYLLPFGFFAIGLLLVWLWYIGELLIRFHLSGEGIIWSRQRRFLITNAVAYALTLYLVRFI